MYLPAQVHLQNLQLSPPEPHELAAMLRIRGVAAGFQLREPQRKLLLLFESYKDGLFAGGGVLKLRVENAHPQNGGRVTLQFADLDYLPLANGKAGHLRCNYQVTFGDQTLRGEIEVAKTVFDLDESFARGAFENAGPVLGKTPIFFLVGKGGAGIGESAPNPRALVEKNPKAALLIFYLVSGDDA